MVIYQWNLSFPDGSLQSLSYCLNPLICTAFQGRQKVTLQHPKILLSVKSGEDLLTGNCQQYICKCYVSLLGMCLLEKECKYILCPTMVFPIGQSEINMYYHLGTYYKYFFSYGVLNSSVYWLNPNTDIKYILLCLNYECFTGFMVMIFVCFCIFFLSGNFKSCSCCLMSWLVKHLMPRWELSKSLNTFLLKSSWHFCLFDLMYDFHI